VKLYPSQRGARMRTLTSDLLALLLVVLFGVLGLKVHDAVDALAVLGTGVKDAGGAVTEGFGAAGDAVSGAPVVGDELGDALGEAGEATGGPVEEAGREGEEAVHDLALLLGLLVFLLPTAVYLWQVAPRRLRQIRTLSAASRALAGDMTPARRQALAMRAAFGLPFGRLLRHTPDPVGDLVKDRYDPLLEALYEDAEMRSPVDG
jgi:hypothetical protein